jgi:hypothetical protein
MRAQLAGLAAAEEPLSIHTFGFGANHDARLLQAIAEAGHGIYYFIQVRGFEVFKGSNHYVTAGSAFVNVLSTTHSILAVAACN